MQNTKLFPIIGLIAIAAAVVPISPAWAQQTVDHSVYGELLESHVKHGLVDYSGFKKDEAQLDRYLSHLEKVDPRKLGRDEQMAFYINAYNAWTIKLILNHYPGVKSIKALGTIFRSPWKKKFVKIDGKTVTLGIFSHTPAEILPGRLTALQKHLKSNTLTTTGRSMASNGTTKIEIFTYKKESGIHRKTPGGKYGKQL